LIAGVKASSLISIQYLRALAALAVVTFHTLQWRTGGFDVGRAGVDIFFVISGLIMWRATAGRRVAPLAFLWRRLTRVAPLYWLATLATAGACALWPGFLDNVLPGWSHLALSLAFIPHLDPRGLPFPTLPPGWTLDYEAIFYLVFAGALLAPLERRAAIVAGALLAMVMGGFLLDNPLYILGANPLLLEFAAGVALARLAELRALPGRGWGLGLIAGGLAGLAGPALLGLWSELWRPLIWGLPAAMIVAGALSLEMAGGVPRWRPLERLGDASYSLYIIHLPVTAGVAHAVGTQRPWLFIPLALSVSITAAFACRAWVEKPLLDRLRGRAGGIEPPYASHVFNRLDQGP
jgi:exopolysaccharide production protein ExoZ